MKVESWLWPGKVTLSSLVAAVGAHSPRGRRAGWGPKQWSESETSNGGRVRLEELKAAPRCPGTGSGAGLPGLKPEGSSHLLSVETLKKELTCKASIFLPVLQEKQ